MACSYQWYEIWTPFWVSIITIWWGGCDIFSFLHENSARKEDIETNFDEQVKSDWRMKNLKWNWMLEVFSSIPLSKDLILSIRNRKWESKAKIQRLLRSTRVLHFYRRLRRNKWKIWKTEYFSILCVYIDIAIYQTSKTLKYL